MFKIPDWVFLNWDSLARNPGLFASFSVLAFLITFAVNYFAFNSQFKGVKEQSLAKEQQLKLGEERVAFLFESITRNEYDIKKLGLIIEDLKTENHELNETIDDLKQQRGRHKQESDSLLRQIFDLEKMNQALTGKLSKYQ